MPVLRRLRVNVPLEVELPPRPYEWNTVEGQLSAETAPLPSLRELVLWGPKLGRNAEAFLAAKFPQLKINLLT